MGWCGTPIDQNSGMDSEPLRDPQEHAFQKAFGPTVRYYMQQSLLYWLVLKRSGGRPGQQENPAILRQSGHPFGSKEIPAEGKDRVGMYSRSRQGRFEKPRGADLSTWTLRDTGHWESRHVIQRGLCIPSVT